MSEEAEKPILIITNCNCSDQIQELTKIVDELRSIIWYDSERAAFQKSFFEKWRKLGTRIKKFLKKLKEEKEEECTHQWVSDTEQEYTRNDKYLGAKVKAPTCSKCRKVQTMKEFRKMVRVLLGKEEKEEEQNGL